MRSILFPDEEQAILDRFEGWELVDFLQVPVDEILDVALENDWIDEDNLPDLLEFLGLRRFKRGQ